MISSCILSDLLHLLPQSISKFSHIKDNRYIAAYYLKKQTYFFNVNIKGWYDYSCKFGNQLLTAKIALIQSLQSQFTNPLFEAAQSTTSKRAFKLPT